MSTGETFRFEKPVEVNVIGPSGHWTYYDTVVLSFPSDGSVVLMARIADGDRLSMRKVAPGNWTQVDVPGGKDNVHA